MSKFVLRRPDSVMLLLVGPLAFAACWTPRILYGLAAVAVVVLADALARDDTADNRPHARMTLKRHDGSLDIEILCELFSLRYCVNARAFQCRDQEESGLNIALFCANWWSRDALDALHYRYVLVNSIVGVRVERAQEAIG